jgi:C4-type Zn-finger protein
MYHEADCDDDEECECGLNEAEDEYEGDTILCPICDRYGDIKIEIYYSHHIGGFIIVCRCDKCGWFYNIEPKDLYSST